MSNVPIEWAAIGIEWSEETVKRQHGDHATDRVQLKGLAQIPVLKDVAAFRANVPGADEILLGIWDRTSVRVQAQDVCRRGLEKQMTRDALREAVWNRLIGVRRKMASGPKPIPLPGGKTYVGTDVVEFRQAYVAALVDTGKCDAELALTIALSMNL